MNEKTTQQQQELRARIAEADNKIPILKGKLHDLESELSRMRSQGEQYRLLEELGRALGKLDGSNAATLYRDATGQEPGLQQKQLGDAITKYRQRTALLEKSREVVQFELDTLSKLKAQLAGHYERVGQTHKPQPFAPHVPHGPYTDLPWSTRGEDDRRFRYLIASAVLFTLIASVLMPMFKPPVQEAKGVVIPERIATLIRKKVETRQEQQRRKEEQAAKREAEKLAEKNAGKEHEKAADKKAANEPEKTAAAETQRSRKVAETKGVLAFKNDRANLLDDSSLPRMGADARISVNAQHAANSNQRTLIVSQGVEGFGDGEGVPSLNLQVAEGSGGINTSILEHEKGNTVQRQITQSDIQVERVKSKVAGSGEASRLSPGTGPSRSDEEIQVIFDRYKSALYRMYNRELRVNPMLRGRLMLQIVIEPDGHVSACTIKEDTLGAPAFANDIVKRVLEFNFGAKKGVPAVTILYPIEFLPPG